MTGLSLGLAPALLAILQAVLLPGLTIITLLESRLRTRANVLVLAFALSLFSNYLVVYVASLIGTSLRPVFFSLIVAELGVLAATALRRPRLRLPSLRAFGGWLETVPSFDKLLLALCFVALALVSREAIRAAGSVLSEWDSLFSWNAFALAWHAGTIPNTAQGPLVRAIPQLIPAVWAMMYSVAGSVELQALITALMPLFPLATAGMMLHLGLAKGNRGFLFGTFVFVGFSLALFRGGMTNGYVDYAAAFYSMLPLYLLILHSDELERDTRVLILAVFLASAATLVKQPAAYSLGVTMLVALVAVARSRVWSRSRKLSTAAACAVIPIAVIGSWYGLRIVEHIQSNWMVNQGDQGNTPLLTRLPHAVAIVPGQSTTIVVILVLGVAACFFDRLSRLIMLAVVPYVVLWALFVSYDTRNLVPILPWTAYLVSAGALGPLRLLKAELPPGNTRHHYIPSRTFLLVFSAAVLAILSAASTVPLANAVRSQVDRQRAVGIPELNAQLYEYGLQSLPRDRLVSDYTYLSILPEFRTGPSREAPSRGFDTVWAWERWLTPELVSSADCLLLSDAIAPEAQARLEDELASGALRLEHVFTLDMATLWSSEEQRAMLPPKTTFALYVRTQ